ncbi:MAG: tetratricopeptide repeat protein [Candidatus Hydrogenedentes bacterium]|nr:tetratricopeptide repeat protein [Candidatus Hydrogenedentota bacterium]
MRSALFVGVALAMATGALFWEVQYYEFVTYDDSRYVYDNPAVLDGLSMGAIRDAFLDPYFANWHPLTTISFLLDASLFGDNPGGYHRTSYILHILNTVLLFAALFRMTGAVWMSGFVAALFALHPYHVEPVVWISSRKDVLSAFFWFLTLWLYTGYARHGGRARYATVCAAFVLGLLSKPMVVTLPFVLLLLDFWPLKRFGDDGTLDPIQVRERVIEKVPLFVLAGLSIVMTMYAASDGGAIRSTGEVGWGDRIKNVPVAYVIYIVKMFWPSGLSPGGYLVPRDTSVIVALLAFALLAAATVALIRLRTRHPYGIVGWLWFLGTLVPVIGLVSIGLTLRTDRYTYVPIIGLFIVIAWGTPRLISSWRYRKEALTAGAALALVACATSSWFQMGFWSDSKHVWGRILEITPLHPQAHYDMGLLYAREGNLDEAILYFVKSLEVSPDNAQTMTVLSSALFETGNARDAERFAQKALKLQPDYTLAWFNISLIQRALGKFDEAEHSLEEAIRLKPDYTEAHRELEALRRRKAQ